jgi:hypothetical protein
MEDFVNLCSGVSVTLGKKSGKNGAVMALLGGWTLTFEVKGNVLGIASTAEIWPPKEAMMGAIMVRVRPCGQIGRIWRCRGIF